jgi:hypothetical protein
VEATPGDEIEREKWKIVGGSEYWEWKFDRFFVDGLSLCVWRDAFVDSER